MAPSPCLSKPACVSRVDLAPDLNNLANIISYCFFACVSLLAMYHGRVFGLGVFGPFTFASFSLPQA